MKLKFVWFFCAGLGIGVALSNAINNVYVRTTSIKTMMVDVNEIKAKIIAIEPMSSELRIDFEVVLNDKTILRQYTDGPLYLADRAAIKDAAMVFGKAVGELNLTLCQMAEFSSIDPFIKQWRLP